MQRYIRVGFLILSLSVPAAARTYYVTTTGNDASNGQTWATAKRTVQAGLNTAVSGDQVWVAKGTYVERITLKNGVGLYGGFGGNEADLSQRAWRVNVTVLDGNKAGYTVTSPSNATATTRIDGFTIKRGKGTYGGGVYLYSSSPTVVNNTIRLNTGSGIYLYNSSSIIANNRISGNDGLGISLSSSSATIANNVIAGNNGTGLSMSSSSGTITNNTIVSNGSQMGGGVVLTSSSPVIANTIIAFNSSGVKTSGGTPVFRSCCVYGNMGYNYLGMSDPTGIGGMIRVDPGVADVPYLDVHLQPGSPCIDAGNNSDVVATWPDIDGHTRKIGTAVDIGADESDGTTWASGPYAIVHVSPQGNDIFDGSSWVSAKKTVQAGIDEAAASGGDVWVAAGTYVENVSVRAGVSLYGGFAGNETQRLDRDWSVNETVLDGNNAASTVTMQVGFCVLDGFTITKGGDSLGGAYLGAGIRCTYSWPTITNNRITGNRTPGNGGGIALDHATATLANNYHK